MRKTIKFLLMGTMLLVANNSHAYTDVEVKNHPLLNTTIETPDYTLVISGENPSYNNDGVAKQHNASLETLGARSSMVAFPAQNLRVTEIFPPQTPFTVTGVYTHKPSFVEAIFAPSYNLAVVEHGGKKYTLAPLDSHDMPFWELNDCKEQQSCNNWRNTLEHCLETATDGHCYVYYNLHLKDDNNYVVFDKNIRPPYKESWKETSLRNFKKYAADNHLDIIFNEIHLTAEASVSPLELMDAFLHYEELGIKLISPLSFSKGQTWEDEKARKR